VVQFSLHIAIRFGPNYQCFSWILRVYSGGGLLGLSPPWTSEIYWFQRVFRPQRVLSPPGKKKKLSPLDEFLNTPMRILFQETSKRTKTNKKNHNRAIPLCNNFYFTQYLKPLIVGIYVACHIQVLNTIVYHLFRPCRVLELKAIPSCLQIWIYIFTICTIFLYDMWLQFIEEREV